MSRDCYVFLKTETFPHVAWDEILAAFGAEAGQPIGTRVTWVIDPAVRLSVQEVGPTHYQHDQYRWQIGIHFSGPYDVQKLWVSVAVPYHCLLLMEQAVFHGYDPDGGPIIDDAIALRRYAKEFIVGASSLEKIAKQGLLDGDGSLILDVRDALPPDHQIDSTRPE